MSEFNLSDLVKSEFINLNLRAQTPEGVLRELVNLFELEEKARGLLLTMLKEREKLGSTGVGKGIAIPHCRSLLLPSLSLAIGRSKKGINFKALDKRPVQLFFLIVAPPQDPYNQYLLTLGKIAQIAKDISFKDSLFTAETPTDFLARLKEIEKVT
ncbi:MAG: PTS sugar transporter subunit IIA [Candidatus Edwardsbacteria bacterium]